MFNMNFAFLAWKEKRIFSRSPNISKHNGDDGPNHYNHISNDKIFKVEKMQNSWHMIWFSSRIPENHSMINASSRVAKSYNLHTLIFPRLSKHRRWRERGVGLGTTLYAWQLASLPSVLAGSMASRRVLDMILLHQVTSPGGTRSWRISVAWCWGRAGAGAGAGDCWASCTDIVSWEDKLRDN